MSLFSLDISRWIHPMASFVNQVLRRSGAPDAPPRHGTASHAGVILAPGRPREAVAAMDATRRRIDRALHNL
jgi:hypothetical protein